MQDVGEGRRRQNGVATRGAIVDAAEELFGEAPYSAIALRDIAKRAGVTIGLLSHHFTTKQDLFEQVMARRAHELNAIAMGALRQHAAPTLEQVVEALLHPLKYLTHDPEWRSYLQANVRNMDLPVWRELRHRLFSPVFRQFYQSMRRAVPDASPQCVERGFLHALAVVVGIVQGETHTHAVADDPMADRDRYYREAALFISGGIRTLVLVEMGQPGNATSPLAPGRRSTAGDGVAPGPASPHGIYRHDA